MSYLRYLANIRNKESETYRCTLLHCCTTLMLGALLSLSLSLSACGGGGSGSPSTDTSGSSGNGNNANVVARYAFVPNTSDNTVSTYVVDSDSGRLKWNHMAHTGDQPIAVTLDPAGQFVYVANLNSGNISQFSLGEDGRLAHMSPPTVAAGQYPDAITTDPSGHHVYVANAGNGTIAQYTIGGNGNLIPMSPATVTAGTNPVSVTISPSGHFAYVADSSGDSIWQYTIGNNGQLSPMNPPAVMPGSGTAPYAIAIDPSGHYAYVANYDAHNIGEYTINGNGKLIPMNPATIDSGQNPRSIAISASGIYVYVANSGSNTISEYVIGNDGTLSPAFKLYTSVEFRPYSITLDPTDKFAYVTNSDDKSVSQFKILPGGGDLVPLQQAIAPARTSPAALALSKGPAVQPVAKFAYVGATGILQYSIGEDGSLTPLNPATIPGGHLVVDPSGNFAYLLTDKYSLYRIADDGQLIDTNKLALALDYPLARFFAAIDPADRYLYVSAQGNIRQYKIAADRTLIPMNPPTVSIPSVSSYYPRQIVIDPAGRHAYIGGNQCNCIWQFNIGSNGTLSPMTVANIGLSDDGVFNYQPFDVTIAPSGRYLYVSGSNLIHLFRIESDGTLNKVSYTQLVDEGNIGIAINPSGQDLYVASSAPTSSLTDFPLWEDGTLSNEGIYETKLQVFPTSISIEPSGHFAFITDNGSNSVMTFTLKNKYGDKTFLFTSDTPTGSSPGLVITTGSWH